MVIYIRHIKNKKKTFLTPTATHRHVMGVSKCDAVSAGTEHAGP